MLARPDIEIARENGACPQVMPGYGICDPRLAPGSSLQANPGTRHEI